MKILIAGSSGIIGSYLYGFFKDKHDLFGIAHEEPVFAQNNFFLADLTRPNVLDQILHKMPTIDLVIFLTGLAHFKGKKNDYTLFESINFNTLKNLTGAFIQANMSIPKIVFASTISVYGENINRENYPEETIPKPESPYAKTKLLAEEYLEEICPNNSWILRFAPVYSKDFQLNIKRRTMLSNKYYKMGNGNFKLSLLNISNIPKAIDEIIGGRVPPGCYNLSDEKPYTYNELLASSDAENIISIPSFAGKLIYYFGKVFGIIYLKENSIKLLSNNIYSSSKLRKFLDLPYVLGESESG